MAVTDLEITSRTSFVSGESFGEVGPYEILEGTAYFAVDPLHARNQGITDLNLAPRNSAGRVEFSSDFAMLQPVNADRGNRRILFDVVNRGRKTALTLNSVPMATDHTAPLQAGNGFPDASRLHGSLGRMAGRRAAHSRPHRPSGPGGRRAPGAPQWQNNVPVPGQRTHPGISAGRPRPPAQSRRRPRGD